MEEAKEEQEALLSELYAIRAAMSLVSEKDDSLFRDGTRGIFERGAAAR